MKLNRREFGALAGSTAVAEAFLGSRSAAAEATPQTTSPANPKLNCFITVMHAEALSQATVLVGRRKVESIAFPCTVWGIPAISIPCGFSKDGLPVGLMIAGPNFSEGRVLALAHAYERATQRHLRKPPLKPEMTVPPIVRKS